MPSISTLDFDLSNVESVNRSEVFPKQILKLINSKGEIEEQQREPDDQQTFETPFDLMPGEYVEYFSRLCSSNNDAIFCTNYRLIVIYDKSVGFYNIPVRSIDSVDYKELVNLHVYSKDGRFLKLIFENGEICAAWYKILIAFITAPEKLDALFAFAFNAWCNDGGPSTADDLGFKPLDYYSKKSHCTDTTTTNNQNGVNYTNGQQNKDCNNGGYLRINKSSKNKRAHCAKHGNDDHVTVSYKRIPTSMNNFVTLDDDSLLSCKNEFERLGFDQSNWKIVDLNKEYKFCPTYPRYFILPATVTEAHVEKMASFRSMKRVPAVAWRHKGNGAVLARCSQPESGIFGWRNEADEFVLHEISKAACCSPLKNADDSQTDINNIKVDLCSKTMLVLDARSYAAAWANRAKGGGYENIDYYRNCNIEFLGLANIHAVRYSFQKLRSLCWESCASSGPPIPETSTSWLQGLDSTQWITYLHILLSSALKVVETLHYHGRCVLVHCSDGWDRTTQIVSLAKLMLDPHYRTMTGFKELIEREWIAFGHKFGERSGLMTGGDISQRAPIFLQWLDCVHHLYNANRCAFEFNENYLVKLAQHVYSGLFGNFLCNSACEHASNNVSSRTYSIWTYLHPLNSQFKNLLYIDPSSSESVKIRPVLTTPFRMRDLTSIWRIAYCPLNTDPAVKRQQNLMTTSTTSLDSSLSNSDDQSDRTVMALSTMSILNNPCSESMIIDQTDNVSGAVEGLVEEPGVNIDFCSTLNQCDEKTYFTENLMGIVDDMINKMIVDVSAKIAVEDAVREHNDFARKQNDFDDGSYNRGVNRSPTGGTSTALQVEGPISNGVPYSNPSSSPVHTEDELDDGYGSKPPTVVIRNGSSTCLSLKNDASTSTSDITGQFLSELDISFGNTKTNSTPRKTSLPQQVFPRRASFSGYEKFWSSSDNLAATPTINHAIVVKLDKEGKIDKKKRFILKKLIDSDGLTKIPNVEHEKVEKIVSDYQQQLEKVQSEISQLRKWFQNQTTSSVRSRKESLRARAYVSESSSDILEQQIPLEKSSAAIFSDASWEAVDEVGDLASEKMLDEFDGDVEDDFCVSHALVKNNNDHSPHKQNGQQRQRTSSSTNSNGDSAPRPVSRCTMCGIEFQPPKLSNCRRCGTLSCDACSQLEHNSNQCLGCHWQVNNNKKYSAAKLCA